MFSAPSPCQAGELEGDQEGEARRAGIDSCWWMTLPPEDSRGWQRGRLLEVLPNLTWARLQLPGCRLGEPASGRRKAQAVRSQGGAWGRA